MLSSHVHSSPAVATPLEPCRVAPYVNVPRLPSLPFPPPGTFSAFDPALLTAAHQVSSVSGIATDLFRRFINVVQGFLKTPLILIAVQRQSRRSARRSSPLQGVILYFVTVRSCGGGAGWTRDFTAPAVSPPVQPCPRRSAPRPPLLQELFHRRPAAQGQETRRSHRDAPQRVRLAPRQ